MFFSNNLTFEVSVNINIKIKERNIFIENQWKCVNIIKRITNEQNYPYLLVNVTSPLYPSVQYNYLHVEHSIVIALGYQNDSFEM